MSEYDVYSAFAVTVTKLQCKISQLENKCKNQTTYLQELTNELALEREETKQLNTNIEELTSTENLLKQNIDSICQSNATAEEFCSDLKNQVALEVEKTKELKIEQDENMAKYMSHWESYQDIYNSFPLAQERNNYVLILKAQDIQIILLKHKIYETKNKLRKLSNIKEKIEQVSAIKMAEIHRSYRDSVAKREMILCNIRTIKQEIEQVKAEKTALLGNTERTINNTKEQSGNLVWSYSENKTSYSRLEIDKKSNLSIPQALQKLKLPEFKITSQPSLSFSNWNTKHSANASRTELRINTYLQRPLNALNKQQNNNNAKNFMEKSHNSPLGGVQNTCNSNANKWSATDNQFSANDKYIIGTKKRVLFAENKNDHTTKNITQNIENLDGRMTGETSQTKSNHNEISNVKYKQGEPISKLNKPVQNNLLKQSVSPAGTTQIPSIELNSTNNKSNTSQLNLNTSLQSLLDQTNLKRKYENGNYQSDTAILNAMKTKCNTDNSLHSTNISSVTNVKTNLEKKQNKENITVPYETLSNNNKLTKLKLQLDNLTSIKIQRFEKDTSKSKYKIQYQPDEGQTNFSETSIQQSEGADNECRAPSLTPPDLPTGSSLSQGSNNSSSEYLTPSALDDAGKIAYKKIVAESPGYMNPSDDSLYHIASEIQLPTRSESEEQSHYFINQISPPPLEETSQDDFTSVGSPPFTYKPTGSYILSPIIEKLPPDNVYTFSPPARHIGDTFTPDIPKPSEMPLFGPKASGDKQANGGESKKTESFNFSFLNIQSKPSIFSLF